MTFVTMPAQTKLSPSRKIMRVAILDSMTDANYIGWLRGKVGTDPVILNATNAIILDESGKVLFMRRGDFTAEPVWGLPGGMMELEESAEETVRREVREETGLEVVPRDFLGTYTNNPIVSYPNGDRCKIILFVFICTVTAGTLQADGTESVELGYFDPKDPPKLFRSYIKDILDDFVSGKRGLIR